MLLAAIDIGSNAVRLFFSSVFEKNGQSISEKATLVRIPIRLGEEVFTQGVIPEHKIESLIKTMKAFKLLMEVYGPVAYKACATSAMREAKNKDKIIERISHEAGIDVEVIDGVAEAKILSSLQNIEELKNYKYSMYVDVGGGSTEISIMSGKGVIVSESFRIGTVRLLKDKVKKKEWTAMQDFLQENKKYYDQMLCVATGGNINKLSKMYGNITDNILPLNNLNYAIKDLEKYTLTQRIEVLGLRPDRADVIIPAAHIYHFIMKNINARVMLVPRIGLIDGMVNILYQQISGFRKKDEKVVL
jgi:exopolyphosphatase / guanosine-5'-triphosphate,3'-diphosphate pyrophosphatase